MKARTAVGHGTRRRYHLGCRCAPCRAANIAYSAAWRQQAATAPRGAIPHGITGYSAYGCRCETCAHARRAADVRRECEGPCLPTKRGNPRVQCPDCGRPVAITPTGRYWTHSTADPAVECPSSGLLVSEGVR